MAADTLRLPSFSPGPWGVKLLLGGALLSVLGLALWLHPRQDRAVDRLQVEGVFQHVTPEAVREAIAASLASGFVALDLDSVRLAVESLPWVARARVERVWPADVRVRVWERVPVARWGDHQLLSSEAVAFTPNTAEIDAKLPLMMASPGHEREVMETYKGLNERLAGSPFALTGLLQDPRGEWTGMTVSGIELRLGRDQPQSKLDTLLGPVTQALGQRLQEVRSIDLRYSNGFSVAWRPLPVAAPAGEENKNE